MDWFGDPQAWLALISLIALEVVLGVDNIVFISIQAGKLPCHQQKKARTLGLGLAMFTRIGLLFSLSSLMELTRPLFTIFNNEISGRDLILIVGGLFLLWKSTMEIHEKLEGTNSPSPRRIESTTFRSVIFQILLLDIVFSIDSIITALGMAEQLSIMILAIIAAVAFMMMFSEKISIFVEHHPTIKMLALSFLIMIGIALIGDGLDMHIPKGYIYFAMAFSVVVEMFNLRLRQSDPVKLHSSPPRKSTNNTSNKTK